KLMRAIVGQLHGIPRKVVVQLALRLLPGYACYRLQRRWGAHAAPKVGGVRFGSLRSVQPISCAFGFDRGQPIDRYYIERFLAQHAADIHGRVLEVGADAYTRRFGGGRVITTDVLHVTPDHPRATIVADLTCAEHIPSNSFDCIILNQTLQLIYEVRPAVRT